MWRGKCRKLFDGTPDVAEYASILGLNPQRSCHFLREDLNFFGELIEILSNASSCVRVEWNVLETKIRKENNCEEQEKLGQTTRNLSIMACIHSVDTP